MLAILNSLNAHNLPIFQPILMILVSKFMVHRAFSDQSYLSLGLLSPLSSHLLFARWVIIPRRSPRDIVFAASVRPHFLSVWSHI